MHPYSQNVSERQLVQWAWTLAVAALSVSVGGSVHPPLEAFANQFGVPGFLTSVFARFLTPFGLFSASIWAFDNHLWKWRVVRWLTRLEVPVLEGDWNGELRSSYRGQDGTEEPEVHEIKLLCIKQTWTRIAIRLETNASSSDSYVASFVLCSGQKPKLVYSYQNDPKYDNVGTMQIHRGTAELTVESECRLAGLYFTGRGREGNYGTMELKKISQ
ncbi:MAG: hypothetical protein OXB89_07445 [Anaerolineaceae bacterium]|nr:hypothetical protein [Anaerolineaceae bacterium]